jgi:hypothetical protein
MPSAGEIRQQVAHESERRSALAVPAFAGGFLYLLGAIVISNTLDGAPTVGLLQGLGPALSGVANPAVSPRTAEVKFISHHAVTLIAGGALTAIAVVSLTLVLLLLLDATRFRRSQSWRAARPLVLYGGILVAVLTAARWPVSAIETHNFVVGHNHSNHAVERALTLGTANVLVEYVGQFAELALAAGIIGTMVNALRVGLIPRWMSVVGIFTGLLIFFPIGGSEFQVVPAFWMVMMGVLYFGRWRNGDPPAWAAGEARPWPPQGRVRGAGSAGNGVAAAATVPAPVRPASSGSSRKRRRKRGARG